MNNLDVLDLLATGLATYGPLALGAMMALAPLGVPLPTALMLVAVGAMSREGIVPWRAMATVALAGAFVGDSIAFALGRLGTGWVRGQRANPRGPVWAIVQERLERNAALAVYLTRFVLTPLPLLAPTNLIAGASRRLGYARFVLCDLLGRLTWLGLYGGMGYVLGSQWEPIGRRVSQYGGWVGAGVALTVIVARALTQTDRGNTSQRRPSPRGLSAVGATGD